MTTSRDDSGPRYDLSVRNTTARLRQAEAHLRAVTGTPAAAAAWRRAQHWRRLQDTQHAGVHWFYLLTPDDAVCTCGLLAPHPTTTRQAEAGGVEEAEVQQDPADAVGHLHPRTWRTVQVFLTPDSRTPADRQVPAGRIYQVVCQRCRTRDRQLGYNTARSVATRHRLSLRHITQTWTGA